MKVDPKEAALPRISEVMSVWLQIRATTLALFLFGFRRVYRLSLRSSRVSHPPARRPLLAARSIAARVEAVNGSYLLFGATCLEASLVLWQMLRRRGVDAEFRLGVRTITGRFESHAWVEYRGQVLNDHPDIRRIYAPMPLPGERRRP